MNWTQTAPLQNLSGSVFTFSSILPESCDPARGTLSCSSTDHGSRTRITNSASPTFNFFLFYLLRTLGAQWTPAIPFLSIASGLFLSPWGCIPPISPFEEPKNERPNSPTKLHQRPPLPPLHRPGSPLPASRRGYALRFLFPPCQAAACPVRLRRSFRRAHRGTL
jgi:hypothetical protein